MTAATWRRPCDAGHCIEVSTDVPGLNPGDIAIRNSQRPGEVVVASAEEYAAWVADVSAPLLAELAEVTRQRDEADAECGRHVENTERLGREINRLTRERDEARAKAVDGGEWTKTYGWRFRDGSPGSVDGLPTRSGSPTGRLVATEQDHWHGPVRDREVEPVTDDGSGT